MWLLHTKTGRFRLCNDPRLVNYAILSHVWAKEGDRDYPEMTFEDVRRIHIKYPARDDAQPQSVLHHFPDKIRSFCETAAKHGYEYGWADACCIDKSSSSELSEAINSMYDWYRYAAVCYVFLCDVPTTTTAGLAAPGSKFRISTWHQRGWTLQELIAPRCVVFVSNVWAILGTKHTLTDLIHEITRIPRDVLTMREPAERFSVACRMSWASMRKTTRVEDEAYSMMGIFGVHMPTNYGEGRYAFIRLQEEILKHISDQSIFAWGPIPLSPSGRYFSFGDSDTTAPTTLPSGNTVDISSPDQFLLASSPKDFRFSSNLVSITLGELARLLDASLDDRPTFTLTPYGVRTRLPLLLVHATDPQAYLPTCLVPLACKDAAGNLVALLLRSQPERPDVDYFVGAVVGQLRDIMAATPLERYFRTAALPLKAFRRASWGKTYREVYIPHRPSLASYNLQRDAALHAPLGCAPSDAPFELQVCALSRELLTLGGYEIIHPSTGGPSTIDVVHKSSSSTISIYVKICDCHYGDRDRLLSVDVSFTHPTRLWSARSPFPHGRDHDSHIQSWTFRDGTASKEFHHRFSDKRVVMLLSLAHSMSSRPLYTLSAEVWTASKDDLARERNRLLSIVTRKTGEVTPSTALTTPRTGLPYITPPMSRDPSQDTGGLQSGWRMSEPSFPGRRLETSQSWMDVDQAEHTLDQEPSQTSYITMPTPASSTSGWPRSPLPGAPSNAAGPSHQDRAFDVTPRHTAALPHIRVASPPTRLEPVSEAQEPSEVDRRRAQRRRTLPPLLIPESQSTLEALSPLRSSPQVDPSRVGPAIDVPHGGGASLQNKTASKRRFSDVQPTPPAIAPIAGMRTSTRLEALRRRQTMTIAEPTGESTAAGPSSTPTTSVVPVQPSESRQAVGAHARTRETRGRGTTRRGGKGGGSRRIVSGTLDAGGPGARSDEQGKPASKRMRS